MNPSKRSRTMIVGAALAVTVLAALGVFVLRPVGADLLITYDPYPGLSVNEQKQWQLKCGVTTSEMSAKDGSLPDSAAACKKLLLWQFLSSRIKPCEERTITAMPSVNIRGQIDGRDVDVSYAVCGNSKWAAKILPGGAALRTDPGSSILPHG